MGKGSACDAKPCGTCSSTKCISSSENSFGFQCSPKASALAIVAGASALKPKKVCWGGRHKQCKMNIVAAENAIGKNLFFPWRTGLCNAKRVKEYKTVRKIEDCRKYAQEEGAKAFTWKTRYHRKWGQQCFLHKDFCDGLTNDNWKEARWWKTEQLQDLSHTFQAQEVGSGLMTLKSSETGDCLQMQCFGQHCGLLGMKCIDGEKSQQFEVIQDCTHPGTLRNRHMKKCVSVGKNTTLVSVHDCDKHYEGQQLSFVDMTGGNAEADGADGKGDDAGTDEKKKVEEKTPAPKSKRLSDPSDAVPVKKKPEEDAAKKEKDAAAAKKKKDEEEAAAKKEKDAADAAAAKKKKDEEEAAAAAAAKKKKDAAAAKKKKDEEEAAAKREK